MSRAGLMWVIAGIVVVCLIVVLLQPSILDKSDSTETSIREYGSLDNDLPGSATGTDGVPSQNWPSDEDVETVGSGDVSPTIERDSIHFEETNNAADAYRISARSTRDFDRKRLATSGLSESEIDKIEQGMRDYARWLRNTSGGEIPAPPIKLSFEERDARRETRHGFLSDDEYAAALFATGQKNAAILARLKEGSEAWDAGLRSGDIIESINGVRVFDLTDFMDGRDEMSDGEMHVLEVSKRGEPATIMVECCRPGWGPVDMTIRGPSNVGSSE